MISIEEILREVRRIELMTKLKVNSSFSGFYHSAFRGSGMQFHDTRTYVPGDDVRHIAWTLTARSPTVQVKRFEEDRELHVLLCVDASRSRHYGGEKASVSRRLTQVAATLGYTAMKNQDLVGAWIFTSSVEKKIPFQKGQSHFLRIVRDFIGFEPKYRGTDFEALFEELTLRLKRRTVVFIISDFVTSLPPNSKMKTAATKHDLIAVHVHDPFETYLPDAGLIRAMDPETGLMRIIDGGRLSANDLKQKVAMQHQRVRSKLLHAGLSYCSLGNPKQDTVDLVRFFLGRSEKVAAR